MNELFKIKLSDKIRQLSLYRSERLDELLSLLNNNQQVSGILLGGSLAYKDDFAKSDVDLFCLINDLRGFESKLHNFLSVLTHVDEIIYQGNFPWTEKLHTIYFKFDIDFSIDLCLINSDTSETFFWEPDGYILFDKLNTIKTCRTKQMDRPEFTRQPFLKSNPFSLSVVTLKKIEKNISRNHLWNALEQLNGLRRYVMQIIRLNVINNNNFLGAVHRDIEDVISSETNLALARTTAVYDAKDIAQKAVMLIEILLKFREILEKSNENIFKDWIIKQLRHEQIKLSNYF